MAFIKGLYEGSWWLNILSRSQPQCHGGTAILETYLGLKFDRKGFGNQNFLKRFFFGKLVR